MYCLPPKDKSNDCVIVARSGPYTVGTWRLWIPKNVDMENHDKLLRNPYVEDVLEEHMALLKSKKVTDITVYAKTAKIYHKHRDNKEIMDANKHECCKHNPDPEKAELKNAITEINKILSRLQQAEQK